MIKKRISILTLILLFFISTTGLPVFYHYCEVVGKSTLTECSDCMVEQQETSSCCAEEIPQNNLKFKSEQSSCCVDKFDYKKIEDDFSQNGSSNLFNQNSVIISDATILTSEKNETHPHQNSFDLPPPKFGKQLLKTIHQLKLDPSVY